MQDPACASRRTPEHLAKNPTYPDPTFYLAFLGKYFFRHPQLRHLRIEAFNRYLTLVDGERGDALTSENTIDVDSGPDPYRVVDSYHRNFDPFMQNVAAGKVFSSALRGCPGARRRHDSRLGCSRPAMLEPSGAGREQFYQQRLLLGLAWYSPGAPKKVVIDGKDAIEWTFWWDPPSPGLIGGASLEREELLVATVDTSFSYELRCKELEVNGMERRHGHVG